MNEFYSLMLLPYRIVVYTSNNKEVVKFLRKAVPDSMVVALFDERYNLIKDRIGDGKFVRLGHTFNDWASADTTDELIRLQEKLKYVAEGYRDLQTLLEMHWSKFGESVTMTNQDLALFKVCPNIFIRAYSEAMNVDIAESEKCLNFEYESLTHSLEIYYRLKIRFYESLVNEVNNFETYSIWRSNAFRELL